MKKKPILMALLILGAIFLFFVVMVVAVAGIFGRQSAFQLGDKVGVIEVTGVISSSKKTIEDLLDFKKDPSIMAIVLRVDSPGGGVGPSQEIYSEVLKASAEKPIVVSMGSVAASGGYYIAAPARRIVANPGTITGSIGVIMEFTSFKNLLEKIGLQSQVVKSGEHKDIGSPLREMTEEDRAILQSLIDDVHQQFVEAVATGRKMDPEKVRSLADGRIFTGRQALSAGLVDQLGNLQDAISLAAEYAGIKGEPQVVYPPDDRSSWIDFLVDDAASRFGSRLREQSGSGYLQFIMEPR